MNQASTSSTDALVVGAGPTGLLLGGALARAGVRPRLVDRRDGTPQESRALAVAARTLEVLDDLGLVPKALARGRPMIAIEAHHGERTVATIEIDDLDSPYPFGLCMPQSDTEEILLEYDDSLGVQPEWGAELVDLEQSDDAVVATLRHQDGSTERVRARYLVGCDGAHSAVRSLSGIEDHGEDLNRTFLLADTNTHWDLHPNHLHAFFNSHGAFAAIPMPEERCWRLFCEYDGPDLGRHPELDVFKRLVAERTPLDPNLFDPRWTTAFHAYQRRAETFKKGRVLLAGDAAHSHSPLGGQGMNTGLQDAYNLAWKLALTLRGKAGDELLESYSHERTRVAEGVLAMTGRATKAITLRGALPRAVRERVISFASQFTGVQQRIGRSLAELSINYRTSPIVRDEWDGKNENTHGQDIPRGGDLVADTFVVTSSGPETIRHVLAGGKHHLLLFVGHVTDAAELAKLRDEARAVLPEHATASVVTRGPLVEIREGVLLDQQGFLHTRYGLDEGPAMLLVRPDHYVGLRSDRHDLDAVRAYFNHLT
jgi:2-polyprenyl-6-methoxyphenol hydroxylase-like FAD-dependent oxidoreductase